jgi:hypothetical protein
LVKNLWTSNIHLTSYLLPASPAEKNKHKASVI